MLNALRRVISEASGIGDQEQQQKPEDQEVQHIHSLPATTAGAAGCAPPHYTIVLEEEGLGNHDDSARPPPSSPPIAAAPLSLVHSSAHQTDNFTTSSSLSGSVDGDEDMEDTPTQQEQETQEDDKNEDNEKVIVENDFLENSKMDIQEEGSNDFMDTEQIPAGATTSSTLGAANTRQNKNNKGIANTNKSASAAAGKADAVVAPPPPFQRMDSVSSKDGSVSAEGSHRNAASSQTSSRDWGWFEDVHYSGTDLASAVATATRHHKGSSSASGLRGNKKTGGTHDDEDDDMVVGDDLLHTAQVVDEEAAAMAVTAPTYVLEESLSSQRLWKDTAGTRPPQPLEERAFYEKMWAQNFARSQVNYQMPVEVLTATSPISLNPFADGVFGGETGTQMITDYNHYTPGTGSAKSQAARGGRQIHHHDGNVVGSDGGTTEAVLLSRMHDISGDDSKNYQKVPGTKSDGDLTILLRGPNAFGTTVSKSFARSADNGGAIVGVDTVNISIASYRVVESKKYGKYAQFLVVYREGSIRDTVGVWKRYRDFEELSNKVTQAHEGCAAVIATISPLAVAEEPETEHLPNAITSWRLLKKRKRWYRCLDAGYLSLKVFLLERFLHDILFESSSPKLLRDFVLGPDGPPL